MHRYQTLGKRFNGRTKVIYSGDDPVKAVDAGLAATNDYLFTWVTENGVKIPGTDAM